jgi:hypothetical protein
VNSRGYGQSGVQVDKLADPSLAAQVAASAMDARFSGAAVLNPGRHDDHPYAQASLRDRRPSGHLSVRGGVKPLSTACPGCTSRCAEAIRSGVWTYSQDSDHWLRYLGLVGLVRPIGLL